MIDYSQTDGFSRGSIVEPTYLMVLHRPVELAGLTGDAVNEFFLKLIGAFLKKIMHALLEWLFHALP